MIYWRTHSIIARHKARARSAEALDRGRDLIRRYLHTFGPGRSSETSRTARGAAWRRRYTSNLMSRLVISARRCHVREAVEHRYGVDDPGGLSPLPGVPGKQ